MPSQPRCPTRRENSRASLSSRLGLNGLKVPAAISSARNARTCSRSLTHSLGRRIGSKRRAAVILNLGLRANRVFLFEHDLFRKTGSHFSGSCSFSARSHQRPQLVRAVGRDALAKLDGPMAFGAE